MCGIFHVLVFHLLFFTACASADLSRAESLTSTSVDGSVWHKLVNSSLLANTEKNRSQYASASPYPHAVFDDLFPESILNGKLSVAVAGRSGILIIVSPSNKSPAQC